MRWRGRRCFRRGCSVRCAPHLARIGRVGCTSVGSWAAKSVGECRCWSNSRARARCWRHVNPSWHRPPSCPLSPLSFAHSCSCTLAVQRSQQPIRSLQAAMRLKQQLAAALAARSAAAEAEELCWLQCDDPACSKWRLASRDCWERVLQVLLGLKSPQPASCLSSLGLALHQQQLCMRALLQAGGEGCCDAIARPAGGGRQRTCSCEQPCDRCCRTRCVCREGSSSAGQPEVQSSPFPGDATTTPSQSSSWAPGSRTSRTSRSSRRRCGRCCPGRWCCPRSSCPNRAVCDE